VSFGGFARVMFGVKSVNMSAVRLMGGFFIIAFFVVLGGFMMVPDGVLVVFGRFAMMFCCILRHISLL
jgi:hypothetical protein